MFEKMRRADRELSQDQCLEIISANNTGFLSLSNPDGYPYGIPMSYMFYENALYFHCAKEGKKLDLISKSNKACFSVISKNDILPDSFATNYQSAIVFGDISKIDHEQQKNDILMKFGAHFGCKDTALIAKYVEAKGPPCDVLRLSIVHMTGKMRK